MSYERFVRPNIWDMPSMNVALPLDFGPVTGFRVGHALVSKPWMTVICYRVDDVLIDMGPRNARTLVQTLVQPESLQGIYLTHYHEDHAGNAGYLQERFVFRFTVIR
ncbi:MAG: MBL fold metallo-hydrolase [Cellvibrionaceae bacterium]|nr:MBL fold metallo-hydrolase [Cellvibrionaceae bacterium]